MTVWIIIMIIRSSQSLVPWCLSVFMSSGASFGLSHSVWEYLYILLFYRLFIVLHRLP